MKKIINNKSALPVLILDFDGVLCDSVIECMNTAVSCTYNHTLITVSDEYESKFKSLRPYAKYGEDYLLIDSIIREKIKINSLQDFSQFKKENGRDLKDVSERFYAERLNMQKNNIKKWLESNPLYDGIAYSMDSLKKYYNIFIVTTKDEDSVVKILEFNKVQFERDKIFGREKGKTKKEIIASLQEKYNSRFYFLEDNLSSLIDVQSLNICRILATWGYVNYGVDKNQTLKGIFTLNLEDLHSFFMSQVE